MQTEYETLLKAIYNVQNTLGSMVTTVNSNTNIVGSQLKILAAALDCIGNHLGIDFKADASVKRAFAEYDLVLKATSNDN